ncbi:hypothetical protein QWY28_13875 [Nocardioides sp. SOB77]|uniref:PQQ-binding-like beta-propeller repeat protein n=1 Tax=Nocardioides oceani TaxID=3058369 RepID=A0ABT8FHX6_9ACTN|nr:hypothetical protein [Nocardioides oceani]MDN4174045.1 hypothetical protein [Nocardioides oceani]
MVNDLRDALHERAAHPPHDSLDLATLVAAGRRRVRRRRAGALAAAAAGTAAAVALSVGAPLGLVSDDAAPADLATAGVPEPDAPTLGLGAAEAAVEGRDVRQLAEHTNDDLDADNGRSWEGVTDDGLLLLRDGPRLDRPEARYALVDPATGEEDWLPDLGLREQADVVGLGEDRLVLVAPAPGSGLEVTLEAHVFDRLTRDWSTVSWPDLPAANSPFATALGPDGRLYVPVPATVGEVPEGGWPMEGGEADDSDAEGDTYRLWSASLANPFDVRDEQLSVGSIAFTEDTLVWTDRTNGDAGRVHVRDLGSGQERSFDPASGERCNLLSFGATAEHVVLGQYCGDYDDVRDDRVQVVGTDGEQVVTIQGDSLDGRLATRHGDGLVAVTSYDRSASGTYVYDLGSGRFLRLSDRVSSWGTDGSTTDGQVLFNTPVNGGKGMTEHLVEVLD